MSDREREEITWGKLDHRGEFDEVWLRDAFVHVERMDDTAWWIGVSVPSGNRVSISTGVYRGEWYFNVDEDGVLDGKSFSVRRPRNSTKVIPAKESLRLSKIQENVCAEIKGIVQEYREQENSAHGVDTPGGLEHMGDVWRLLSKWSEMLS